MTKAKTKAKHDQRQRAKEKARVRKTTVVQLPDAKGIKSLSAGEFYNLLPLDWTSVGGEPGEIRLLSKSRVHLASVRRTLYEPRQYFWTLQFTDHASGIPEHGFSSDESTGMAMALMALINDGAFSGVPVK